MKLNKHIWASGLILLLAAPAWAGEAGTLLKDDEVRAEPFLDAKVVANLVKGDKVDILERDGGWFRVKTGKGGGWVHMLSVRKGDAHKASGEGAGLLALSSGRSGTGAVLSTTGIRGVGAEANAALSPAVLSAAQFNEAELMRAESYLAANEQVQKFARQGGLAAVRLDYLADAADAAPHARDRGCLREMGGSSQDQDVATGRQIMGNLLGAVPLVRDNALQAYVNNVGRWVASQSERPDLPWHFGVLDSKDIGAVSAPGGYVFITLGLYDLLQTESELAGVLGHEIGHVVCGHLLKTMQGAQSPQKEPVARGAGTGNSQIQAMIGRGAEIVLRPMEAGDEFEADRIAVVLAVRAGYDAFGLPAVLLEIGGIPGDDSRVAPLLSTSPAIDARVDELADVMAGKFETNNGQMLDGRLYRPRQRPDQR